jgi:uroporphyrinogen decarboxylase
MNSIERYRLALAFQEPDRVPVAPSFLTRAAKIAGERQFDYHTNPNVLATAQISHCDRYDFNGVFISSDNVIMYEALGGKVFYPNENSYPFWTDPVLKSSSDLSRLKVPKPLQDGRMPVIIEAARIAVERAGDRRFVLANIDSGPFLLAMILMGMEQGMTCLVEKPAEMKEISEFCSQITIAYGAGMAQSGCHGIQFGGSTATLIGRKRYVEFIYPYDCKVIQELKKLGVSIFLHVCSNSTPLFDLLVESGADCLEFDSQVDIVWAKQQAGKKIALKGNINTTDFISLSSEQMTGECRRIIESAKAGSGFILCGGCEVPADTPDEILHSVRRSVDLFGTY